jgi:hypothetical protein
MFRFLKNIVLFILPVIVLGSIEVILPLNFFNYRPYESLLFLSSTDFVFYPGKKLDMLSVGDLCHHSGNAVVKNECWKTDALGYRNDRFIKDPDILLIGDSFIVGSSITQDSTLANCIKNEFHDSITAYSLAPASFLRFVSLLNGGIIHKPSLVIYSAVERKIPPPLTVPALAKSAHAAHASVLDVILDRATRFYSIKYLHARLLHRKGEGVNGVDSTNMFFVTETTEHGAGEYAVQTAESLSGYKKYCDSIGIQFLFLPVPKKETVYYDYVPLEKQPGSLAVLDSLLNEHNISTINTLQAFNNHRKNNGELIYHLDDTHWNARGVEITAKNICRYVRTHTSVHK